MKFTTEDGKEWAFRGEYRHPIAGEFYMGLNEIGTGRISRAPDRYYTGGARVIVHEVVPPPVRHTFGGVVFEETAAARNPKIGEWFLQHERITYTSINFTQPGNLFPILRAVFVTEDSPRAV